MPAKPVRRAVILMQTYVDSPEERRRCTDAGADVVFAGRLHVHVFASLLFGGPETNVVSLYGGVDEVDLREAGYPLKMPQRHSSRMPEAMEAAAASFG